MISLPGIGLLKLFNASTVLVFAALVFVVARPCSAAAQGCRDARAGTARRATATRRAVELDVPIEDREVMLGLTASATVRLSAGFLTFLIAFGLRRGHAPLWWYGFAFAASGVGALVGLYLVRRLRRG